MLRSKEFNTFSLNVKLLHGCRFDARGKPLSLGRRWSEVPSFGLRADFRFSGTTPTAGYLIINATTTDDEGLYRCRVDFKNSPARHSRVKLNVTGRILSPISPFSLLLLYLQVYWLQQ